MIKQIYNSIIKNKDKANLIDLISIVIVIVLFGTILDFFLRKITYVDVVALREFVKL